MKTIKAICETVMVICLLVVVYGSLRFDGDSISLDGALIIMCIGAIVGGISFIGYVALDKYEEENADWMELLKKPQGGNRRGRSK